MSGLQNSSSEARLRPNLASVLRVAALVVAGTCLLTLSAKINVPFPYVPMTMQSLVVPLIGISYGWRLGLLTVLAYLAEGALGLPVFAGPVGGVAYMAGPTGGYLVGFVIAVFVCGWLSEKKADLSLPRLFGSILTAHVIIIGCGFGWLIAALHLGAGKAWLVGVVPFVAGSVIKSALGAAMVAAFRRFTEAR